MYGDLHGHSEHLHETCYDSGKRWQRQKEVNCCVSRSAWLLQSSTTSGVITSCSKQVFLFKISQMCGDGTEMSVDNSVGALLNNSWVKDGCRSQLCRYYFLFFYLFEQKYHLKGIYYTIAIHQSLKTAVYQWLLQLLLLQTCSFVVGERKLAWVHIFLEKIKLNKKRSDKLFVFSHSAVFMLPHIQFRFCLSLYFVALFSCLPKLIITKKI